ncbi:hypothetical protein M422DRAFT_24083 [Sphaerobolus stellatus SS14]|nr:hypothetical protein M422DRAFT_24083 [Sphaerobolus stellatus SS14]
MGSIQSILTPTNIVAAALVVGITARVWRNRPSDIPGKQELTLVEKSATAGRKGKKKKPAGGKQSDLAESAVLKSDDGAGGRSASPDLASSSMSEHTIPGGLFESREDLMDSSVGPAKPVKEKKKKKAKKSASQTAGSHTEERSEAAPVAGPSRATDDTAPRAAPAPTRSQPAEETWTRVETKRKSSSQHATSDAGITTTSMDEEGSLASLPEKSEDAGKTKPLPKTFAEKMLPKGRKTVVDDMLETPHHPEIARVIRVTPTPNEKPAAGFSWADYEDVEDAPGAEADGEDDSGWGIVKSRGRAKHPQSSGGTSSPPSKASETMNKKQRQRAMKKESDKASRAEGEAERLATLARHRREAEKAKIAELYKPGKPKIGGGMFASLDSESKLVWE